MKKIVLYSMLLCCILMTKAQEPFICADEFLEETNSSSLPPPNFSGSVDPAFLASFEPVVFNVVFWKVVDPNGQVPAGEIDLQEEDVLGSIAAMNIEYNPYKIFLNTKLYKKLSAHLTYQN